VTVALSSQRPINGRVQRAPDAVPSAVRRLLEPALGTDLSGVRVHRGESSTAAARSLRAEAFTAGGEVHIPATYGSLESGKGRELLAHELVHVAQQRSHGPSLPHEDSPRGQLLEAEAVAVGSQMIGARPASESATAHSALSPAPAPLAAIPRGAAPVTQRAPVTTATAAAPHDEHVAPAVSEAQLDDLARRLYPPLRRQLRTELLVDRERSGRMTDR
jgi:hypothetical protein